MLPSHRACMPGLLETASHESHSSGCMVLMLRWISSLTQGTKWPRHRAVAESSPLETYGLAPYEKRLKSRLVGGMLLGGPSKGFPPGTGPGIHRTWHPAHSENARATPFSVTTHRK